MRDKQAAIITSLSLYIASSHITPPFILQSWCFKCWVIYSHFITSKHRQQGSNEKNSSELCSETKALFKIRTVHLVDLEIQASIQKLDHMQIYILDDYKGGRLKQLVTYMHIVIYVISASSMIFKSTLFMLLATQ